MTQALEVQQREIEGLTHQVALWEDMTPDRELSLVGPLGSGKSFGLAVKQFLLRRDNKECDGILVVPTLPLARLIHVREWPAIWMKLGVRVKWRAADFAFEWPWGKFTWVRSAENPERLVGANLGDAMFDEPAQMSEEAYSKASARVRHPGAKYRQKVSGGTPEGINWFSDRFDGRDTDPVRDNRRLIRAKGWHPDLAHYRLTLKELYGHDEALFKSYGQGLFVPLRVGLCYPQFSTEKHVDSTLEYNPELPLVLACDFNVMAMRWLICQVTDLEIRVLDEIGTGVGLTTERCAQFFCKKWGEESRVLTITGDRAGNTRSTQSTKTDYVILVEECLNSFGSVSRRVPSDNPEVKDRIDNVGYNLAGRGKRVRVHPRCLELIKDFERVAWKDNESGTAKEDQKDMMRTHAAAAFGYLCWMYARAVGRGGGIQASVAAAQAQKEGSYMGRN